MNNIVKKLVIYPMVGIMQVSFGAAVASASPIYIGYNEPQRIVQLDNNRHDRDNDRRREHDRRMREENKRHEQEMRRHRGESERAWRERQKRENQRHDDSLREIAALLIGIAIGSSID